MNAKQLINDFKSDVLCTKLRNEFSQPSFLEIHGMHRIEAAHSKFISWLLSNKMLYANKVCSPIERFIEVVLKRYDEQGIKCNEFTESYLNTLRSGNYEMLDVDVDEEVSYKDDDSSHRIDLIITCGIKSDSITNEVKIYLENKVCAPETFNKKSKTGQTVSYYDTYNNKDEIQFFVHLSPATDDQIKNNSNIRESEFFACITYQDVLDHVLMNVLNSDSIDSGSRFFIQQYCRALGWNSTGTGFMMAQSSQTKADLNGIWTKHSKLIRSIVIALMHRRNYDSEKYKCLFDENDSILFGEDDIKLLTNFWNVDGISCFIRSIIDSVNADVDLISKIKECLTLLQKDYQLYELYDKTELNNGKPSKLNKSNLVGAFLNLFVKKNPNMTAEGIYNKFIGIREPFIKTKAPYVTMGELKLSKVKLYYNPNSAVDEKQISSMISICGRFDISCEIVNRNIYDVVGMIREIDKKNEFENKTDFNDFFKENNIYKIFKSKDDNNLWEKIELSNNECIYYPNNCWGAGGKSFEKLLNEIRDFCRNNNDIVFNPIDK